MTEILATNSEVVVIIEENDESTLVAQTQEVTTIVEMEPGVPWAPGATGPVWPQWPSGLDWADGADWKSAYQSYLDTTTDDPVKSEGEWASLQVDHVHDIADVTGLQTALLREEFDCLCSSTIPWADYTSVAAAIADWKRIIEIKGTCNDVDCTFPDAYVYIKNNWVWSITWVIDWLLTGTNTWIVDGGEIQATPWAAWYVFKRGSAWNKDFKNCLIVALWTLDDTPIFQSTKFDATYASTASSYYFSAWFQNCVIRSVLATTTNNIFRIGSLWWWSRACFNNTIELWLRQFNNTFYQFLNTTMLWWSDTWVSYASKILPSIFMNCKWIECSAWSISVYGSSDISWLWNYRIYVLIIDNWKIETCRNIYKNVSSRFGNAPINTTTANTTYVLNIFDYSTTPDINSYRQRPLIDWLSSDVSIIIAAWNLFSWIWLKNITAYRISGIVSTTKTIIENCRFQTLVVTWVNTEVINTTVKWATGVGTITVSAWATWTLIQNCITQAAIVDSGTGTILSGNTIHL